MNTPKDPKPVLESKALKQEPPPKVKTKLRKSKPLGFISPQGTGIEPK